jgi:putative ABC transport system substrate-binding protein
VDAVEMAAGRARALYVALDPLFLEQRTRIVELAANVKEFVAAGLMSYGPDIPDLFSRGAYFVDRILKGTKPADLPVEQPTLFKLVINLRHQWSAFLTVHRLSNMHVSCRPFVKAWGKLGLSRVAM